MAATESHFVDVTRRHEYEHKAEMKGKHRSGEYGEKKARSFVPGRKSIQHKGPVREERREKANGSRVRRLYTLSDARYFRVARSH